MFVVGFLYMTFIMLRWFPCFLCWGFNKRMWILSDTFSALIEVILSLFFFHSVDVLYYIDYHSNVESFSHSRNKSHLVYNLTMWLNSFCYRFIGDFCMNVHKGSWSVLFFSYSVFVWLWYQCNASLIKWVRKCALLFSSLAKFEKNLC